MLLRKKGVVDPGVTCESMTNGAAPNELSISPMCLWLPLSVKHFQGYAPDLDDAKNECGRSWRRMRARRKREQRAKM